MSNEPKECVWKCEYWAADMDSDYCSHPSAMKISWAGVSLNRMLGAAAVKPAKPEDDPAFDLCGKERKLWKERSPDRLPIPRS